LHQTGAFKVEQFDGITEIYPRRTAVDMVMKNLLLLGLYTASEKTAWIF